MKSVYKVDQSMKINAVMLIFKNTLWTFGI